jgi:imidazolonepropionase-like amidohydrolase
MNRTACVCAVVVLLSFRADAQLPLVVLEGGTLIDGRGGRPINDAVVVIEGPRIKAVGVRGRVSYPDNARVIRADGRTILPGLIDPHIHLRDYMPPLFLRYGVTTVGDTNNDTEWILWQRGALRSGQIKGPRLYVSGTAAAGPDAEESGISHRLATPDEARSYVRGLIARGVDMLKVDLNLTLEQLRAITDEAAKAGVPVVGHSQNIRKAVEIGGLRYMEHTDTLGRAILEDMGPETLKKGGANPERLMDTNRFEPLIRLMVRERVFVNPTVVTRWRSSTPRGVEWANAAKDVIRDPALAFVPEDVRASWTQLPGREPDAEGYRRTAEFLRRYAQAGGKVLAGTDAGFMPGLSLHYEMQLLTDMGVPPMNAIQGATLWAAESIGQGKELGSIEAGKLADVTVIEGNPLTDIAATKNVRMVIKDGQVLDTSYDPRFINPMPRPNLGGR